MPPKKAKVKVSKSTKSGTKQGVKINIVIDQSKKTRGGNAPKPPIVRRALPAFSAMPQGPSYVGQQYRTTTQDSPLNISTIDYNILGKRVFNHLLEESQNREKSASGFSGFQTAGSQANQIFDGIYRPGSRGEPIILEPQNDISTAVDRYITDDPQTNSIISANKLDNRGSRLPQIGENSIVELNAEERRDNALDNLVSHEQKSRAEIDVNTALDEDLLEEIEDDEGFVLKEISSLIAQEQRGKELLLESEEDKFRGRNVTSKMRKKIYDIYELPPTPQRNAPLNSLRDYITKLNEQFGTSYETNFKGKRAQEDLRRVIRIALLKEYDEQTA